MRNSYKAGFFETEKTMNFFTLIKAFPAEELYRIVVDGTLHASEHGWIEYEKREPGCLKAFFEAFLFICQNKNAALSIEYVQTIQALCSNFDSTNLVLPGKIYRCLYLNNPELLKKYQLDHSFTIPHERASIAGIKEYLDNTSSNPCGILGKLVYEGVEILPYAYRINDNQKLAEVIYQNMVNQRKNLRYFAPRENIYKSMSLIVSSYQNEMSLALN